MRNKTLMSTFVAFVTLLCSTAGAQTAVTDQDHVQVIQGTLFVEPEYFVRKHIAASPKPEYPDGAKQAGIGGEVIVFVWFDKFGDLIEAKPLVSPHESLSEAAVMALKNWRIKPYTEVVDAAGLVSEVRFIFSLTDGEPKVTEAPADKQRAVSAPFKKEMERRRKGP